MRTCFLMIILLCVSSCASVTLDKEMQGVFANKGSNSYSAVLVINADGIVLFTSGFAVILGKGEYDKETQKFIVEYFESNNEEALIPFLFDKEKRTYTIQGTEKETFIHISDEIPKETKAKLKLYPKLKEEMQRKKAIQEATRKAWAQEELEIKPVE